MKRVSNYLKMRVLGAIDFAEGNSIQRRIKKVSEMTFADEDGTPPIHLAHHPNVVVPL
jgi:hypothetical protein